MKNTLKHFSAILLIFIMISCTKDFIVKDIKNSVVTIIAPADNLSTPNNQITFWWEEVDGAENYDIQIVKPSFSSVQQLIVDTTVVGTKFNHTFTPGTYQWRIRASNSGGSTAYFTRTLTIDTTSNMNLVSVSLVAPADHSVTANNSVTFSWNPLTSADYYELTLKNVVTNSITTIPNITGTNYPYSFTVTQGNEEVYEWYVKAFNNTTGTQTINNTVRTFKIDKKSPLLPGIISPNTYSLNVRDTTYLKWSRNSASMDIAYDVISISSDSTFSSVLGTQNVSSGNQIRINGIYTYTGSATPVWWRVTSVDSVGNMSTPNQSKRFYLY